MRIKEIVIALFALLLLLGLAFLWLSPEGGRQAPAVAATTLEGKVVNIQDYRGRPLLVVFWATTCPGCIQEMPHLVELYQELAPQGLEILAVAMAYDPPQQVRTMVRQRALPYTVAIDHDGRVAQSFGDVRLTPTTFLIDPRGRIAQEKLGELDMGELRMRIIGMLSGENG